MWLLPVTIEPEKTTKEYEMHTIERDVPLPEDCTPRRGKKPKYGFLKMQVGDSFSFDIRHRSTVRNSTKSHARRHGVRFFIGVDENGQGRVWRVA